MEKISKLLHKKLDKNCKKDKHLNAMKAKFEQAFKLDHISYSDSDAFHYYQNEIVYRGIANKKIIEDAYFQGLAKMHDYYFTLEFKEKQRMMNYEIHEALKTLDHFRFHDDEIYIPFFDEKLNRIYQNEIVLFDLKQYRRIINEYNDLMVKSVYGVEVYQSAFSSLHVIAQHEQKIALYDAYTKRLFFIENDCFVDFITISQNDSLDVLRELSIAYFYRDDSKLVEVLLLSKNIDEKLAKKLNKLINRK